MIQSLEKVHRIVLATLAINIVAVVILAFMVIGLRSDIRTTNSDVSAAQQELNALIFNLNSDVSGAQRELSDLKFDLNNAAAADAMN